MPTSLIMDMTKLHRNVVFKEKTWLKACIFKNTKKTQATISEFLKEFHKLYISAFSWRTKENLRKGFYIRPVKSDDIETK